MGDGLPWFPFYADDWLTSRKVRRLTWGQRGIYQTLLAEQWTGGPLPDASELAELIEAEEGDVMRVLSVCFTETADGWVNERLEEVRGEQEDKRAAKVRAGKAGAKARWKQGKNSNRIATPSDRYSNRVEEKREDTPPSGGDARAREDEPNEGQESKPKRKRSATKRKTQLPADWKPNEGHHERAAKEGVDCEKEAEKFRLHHEAKGSTMVSWDKAFTTWLIRAKEFNRSHGRRDRPPPDSEAAQFDAEAERWRDTKRRMKARTADDIKRLNVGDHITDPNLHLDQQAG